MNIPKDKILYNKIKKKINKTQKPSAYRSGNIVRTYKKQFAEKYGIQPPYIGNKTKKKGLSRWFKEEWKNQRGEIGYSSKSDIYRPTKRITHKTPITIHELTNDDIDKARRKKYKTGRVKRFKGGGNDFKPNLTPYEIFKLGSFGGTYWRPIDSKFYKTKLRNQHHKYKWSKKINDSFMTTEDYDIQKNKYKVKVGTDLEFWEKKNWIKKSHPYGWVQWYCDYSQGERSDDDERQIKRWKKIAGKNGRFMRFLVTQIIKSKKKYNDETVSPKIRQVLQHWGYTLTKDDFIFECKRRNIKYQDAL